MKKENNILDNVFLAITKKLQEFYQTYRLPFWSGLIVGLLTHMYMLTNKLPNNDDIFHLFRKGATLESGRWVLPFFSTFLPDYSMPWINGLFSILIFTIAACLILHVLRIRNKTFQALATALIISFPSLTGTMGYMFTVASYSIVFLLSVVAVYLFQKGGVWNYCLGIVPAIVMLAVYQAYISVISTLFLILLAQFCLQQDAFRFSDFLKKGCAMLSFLILSVGAYWVLTQLVLLLTNQEFGSYATGNLHVDLSPLSRLISCYYYFYRIVVSSYHGLVATIYAKCAIGILLVLVMLIFCYFLFSAHSILQKISLLFVSALIPLSVCCMYLITNLYAVHSLVLYSFVLCYLYVIVIFEALQVSKQQLLHLGKQIAAIALAVTVCTNVFFGNQAYLELQLRYENVYAFYSDVVYDIKTHPQYQDGKPVAVLGRLLYGTTSFDQFARADFLTGTGRDWLDTGMFCNQDFITYYIGFDAQWAEDEKSESISSSEEFQEMPCYPQAGSIREIDGVLVVKLA